MREEKHILYLSYDGLTDPLGQSQILPYLIGLRKKGYHFDVISFEKEERFSIQFNEIKRICTENKINWHPLPYTKKPPVISTIRDIRKMLSVAKKIHRDDVVDIVHCRSYLSAIIGRMFKKKYGTKFLFDMRGFWADERVEGNIWSLKNPLYRWIYGYFKRQEKAFFENADQIISLTQNGKETILSMTKNKLDHAKITVIPCCVDTDLFDPKRIDIHQLRALKSALSISDNDFILGYVGSIGTWYMLDEMMLFFKVFLKKNPLAKFMFVTNESVELIKMSAAKYEVDWRRIIHTSTTHKHVPIHIALFDWSIFFIRPTFSKRASSPTKQGEIMAMGKPLICNAGVGDTDEIVRRYSSGLVIEDLSEASFLDVTLPTTSFQSSELRKGAERFFGLTSGVERYAAIYANLN
jgi:glycosyltransferase involved in cell wall biosynthesis